MAAWRPRQADGIGTTKTGAAGIGLAGEALGWDPTRPNEAFFRWKHLDNSFGASPMWVAELDGRLVGVRTFLRWRFRRPDGTTFAAVRAVDTAFAADASIVMAYLGHQIADYTLRDAGFARINEINQSIGAESDPLILLLERVWTR